MKKTAKEFIEGLNFCEIFNTFCERYGKQWASNTINFFNVLEGFIDEMRDKIIDLQMLLENDTTLTESEKEYYTNKCNAFLHPTRGI